jgi:hypothetical protein
MEAIFIHHGYDGRHFGDLVADRFGVITGECIAAPAASGRLTVEDLAELLGGYEWAGLAMMAGLPTPLLARGGGRRPSLDRGGIGGGGLGGIGGILAELLFEVGDPLLEGLDQARDSGLYLGRERIPESLRERRLGHHDTVLQNSSRSGNIGP